VVQIVQVRLEVLPVREIHWRQLLLARQEVRLVRVDLWLQRVQEILVILLVPVVP